MKIAEKLSPKEIAESYVFPGSKNKVIRQKQIADFQQYRSQYESRRSDKDRLISQLLQLKFQIENYINSTDFNSSSQISQATHSFQEIRTKNK